MFSSGLGLELEANEVNTLHCLYVHVQLCWSLTLARLNVVQGP